MSANAFNFTFIEEQIEDCFHITPRARIDQLVRHETSVTYIVASKDDDQLTFTRIIIQIAETVIVCHCVK